MTFSVSDLNFVYVSEGNHDDDEDEGARVRQLFRKYAVFA